MKNTNNPQYSTSSSKPSEIDEIQSNSVAPDSRGAARGYPECSCSCSPSCPCSPEYCVRNKLKFWDAMDLLNAYRPVCYHAFPAGGNGIWEYAGGEALHLHQTQPADYSNSCALRLSLALNNYKTFDLETYAKDKGLNNLFWIGVNPEVNGGKQRVLLRALDMIQVLNKLLGSPDYPTEDAYNKHMCENDIIIWGKSTSVAHVGMGRRDDRAMGNGGVVQVWVLNRPCCPEPEVSVF